MATMAKVRRGLVWVTGIEAKFSLANCIPAKTLRGARLP